MGRIRLELGDIDHAIEKLNEALEIDPNAFDAYMLMSSAYEKMGRNHEARAALQEAKRIRPNAPEVVATKK
jgi:Tfp pilus assembly protein PilF